VRFAERRLPIGAQDAILPHESDHWAGDVSEFCNLHKPREYAGCYPAYLLLMWQKGFDRTDVVRAFITGLMSVSLGRKTNETPGNKNKCATPYSAVVFA
jgi:hypothetical protein